jgi:hypothetical protein
MKNVAINTLKYTGIVTLSQYIGTKKVQLMQVHNAGGKPLLDFLYECLIGNFDTAQLNMPTKIMLLKAEEVGDDTTQTHNYHSSSLSFIHLRTKPEKTLLNDSQACVTYSFTISRDQIQGDFDHIGLYTATATSQDLNNYAAICEVDLSTAEISLSSALVVDWQLLITN